MTTPSAVAACRAGVSAPRVALRAAVALIAVAGCGRPPAAPPAPAASNASRPVPMAQGVRDQLLSGAIDVLGRLDDYDESAASAQVFDRLNQWSHAVGLAGGAADWQPDPLLTTLPARLADDAPVKALVGGLGSGAFDAAVDVQTLRDQRWLADIAATARRDAVDDLDVARQLFAWTIRALAISVDPPAVPTADTQGTRWFLPGEILLAGRGSGAQRSWIFLELLRHAGLDGVMLATGSEADGGLRPWVPAVISAGEAYLFEPTYGMPVPGPGGAGIATARQAAADPAILTAMSLPDRAYPVQATDIARLSVLVPAAPWNLARRMARIDAELVGTRRLTLAIDASALGRSAAAALPGDATAHDVRLWSFPWETLVRRTSDGGTVNRALGAELAVMSLAMTMPGGPGAADRVVRPLYVARLREFRGELDGPDGAKRAYLLARPSAAAINAGLAGLGPQQADGMKRLYGQLKENATYFLGVLTLGERDYETAVDYLGRMTLEEYPDGVWADAARLNLAEAKLGLGLDAEAVALLRDDPSPQRFGSRLRAERITPQAR
jgi:hypothetical protein